MLLQSIDECAEASVLRLRVRREPENARRGAIRRLIKGLVTLHFDDGTFFPLGHEAIKCADKVDRDLGFAQGGEDAFAHTRRIERRGAGRHDWIVARFQLAAQLFAFLAQVAGGPGEKHGVGGGNWRSSRCGAPRRCHRRQQSGKVVSDIVNPGTKHLAGVPGRIEQEITGAL